MEINLASQESHQRFGFSAPSSLNEFSTHTEEKTIQGPGIILAIKGEMYTIN